jgi:hypothetical protein
MHPNLAHMCVTTVLMVADYSYLDHKRPDRLLADVVDGNHDPTCMGRTIKISELEHLRRFSHQTAHSGR